MATFLKKQNDPEISLKKFDQDGQNWPKESIYRNNQASSDQTILDIIGEVTTKLNPQLNTPLFGSNYHAPLTVQFTVRRAPVLPTNTGIVSCYLLMDASTKALLPML